LIERSAKKEKVDIPLAVQIGDKTIRTTLQVDKDKPKLDLEQLEQFFSGAVRQHPMFQGRHISVALIELTKET